MSEKDNKDLADKIVEVSQVYEMATLGPKDHKLGINVKINILQPGPNVRPGGHGPRLKIFTTDYNTNFEITFSESPEETGNIIGDYKKIVNTKVLNQLIQVAHKYRRAFLKFWNDPGMSPSELRDEMSQIDQGD